MKAKRDIAPMEILHVDDSRADHILLRIMLEESGLPPYNLTHVECPQIALETNLNQYHLVITDGNMPRMHGADFIHRVRKKGYGNPIMMLTGSDDPTVETRAYVAGADLVLPKRYATDEIGSDSMFHPKMILPFLLRSYF
ncbi:MAG: response regulator [Candidatus Nanoarchaeia archaeon]